ncbi:MAG: methyltransferase family protein [Luteimonas sp.]
MSPQLLFGALCIAWFASELWIGRRRRSADAARTRDAGTLRLLLVTIYTCVALAVWLAGTDAAPFAPPVRVSLFWAGLAMMAAGMAFRAWSIRVLARFFTVDVTIRPDHRLVRSGPYRLLRHPSYTGALATFYGFALALGDAGSLLVIVLPVTAAFLWRIRIEERVLADAFPDEYPHYARVTKRLIPYLW